MKKKLLAMIVMFSLAVALICGVTFAYFQASNRGGENKVEIGAFVFESVAVTNVSTQVAAYDFSVPTVINVPHAIVQPEIQDVDYDRKYRRYLSDGDDEMFDRYVIPVFIQTVNKSAQAITVRAKIEIEKTTPIDFSPALRYFVLDKSLSASVSSGGAEFGLYAAAIRSACVGIDSGLATDASDADMTEKVLEKGNLQTEQSLMEPNSVLGGGAQIDLVALVWLDARAFKTIASIDRNPTALRVKVTVTANQIIN